MQQYAHRYFSGLLDSAKIETHPLWRSLRARRYVA
jgi:hypothetical protein